MILEHAKLGDDSLQDVHAQLMREKEEPTEGFSPIPIYLLFVFCALTFWAGIYFEANSGHFKWYAYSTDFEVVDPSSQVPIDYDSLDWLIPRGERLYNANCATCHQTSGMGSPGVYPPLVDSRWVDGDPDRLIAILLHGLVGPIEVKGNQYNGNMPAFGAHPAFRRDRDLAAVMTYVRNAWGNAYEPILESQVTSLREELGNRGPWDGTEILQVYPLN